MKYGNVVYAIAAVMVLAGTTMKVVHTRHGDAVLLLGLVCIICCQAWELARLKGKMKTLKRTGE